MIPRPRRLYRRVKRQDIGLEGDTVDKSDDFRHLLCAVGNGLHIVSDLSHQLAALARVSRRDGGPLAGEARVVRIIFRADSHLLHAGRRLNQRSGLLLRLYRQLCAAVRELLRERHCRMGGGAYFPDQ